MPIDSFKGSQFNVANIQIVDAINMKFKFTDVDLQCMVLMRTTHPNCCRGGTLLGKSPSRDADAQLKEPRA